MKKKIYRMWFWVLNFTMVITLNAQLKLYDNFDVSASENLQGDNWEIGSVWNQASGSGLLYSSENLIYGIEDKELSFGGSMILSGENVVYRFAAIKQPLFETEFFISFLFRKDANSAFEFHGNYNKISDIGNSRIGIKVSNTGSLTAKSGEVWAPETGESQKYNFSSEDGLIKDNITYLVIIRKVGAATIVGVYQGNDKLPKKGWKIVQSSRTDGVSSAKLDTYVFKSISGRVEIDEFKLGVSLLDVLE